MGEKHIALIFVHGSPPDEADQVAIDHLESTGWSEVRVEERGELDSERLTANPDFAEAYERCLVVGSAGIIFKDPLDE